MICNCFQRLRSGVELAEAAIDQNQAGHRFLFFLQALVAARDGFEHAGEVVVFAANSSSRCHFAANNEFSIVGFLHAAIFPNDHGGNRIGSLNVRNVETFDALGFFGKIKGALQRFGYGLGCGLEYAEALFEGMLGIVFH